MNPVASPCPLLDKTDFGSPIYFMTEQQYNYCMWHLDDYNKMQERAEKAEDAIKKALNLTVLTYGGAGKCVDLTSLKEALIYA